jgi:hypothetical protein
MSVVENGPLTEEVIKRSVPEIFRDIQQFNKAIKNYKNKKLFKF